MRRGIVTQSNAKANTDSGKKEGGKKRGKQAQETIYTAGKTIIKLKPTLNKDFHLSQLSL